ncbi:hypothetical protein EXU57_19080 [Segetibacter sp. 3557_3]|uniref:hypothetical protein n=1 Tax=Segetibacter sp. 3557_3 TaxID=2547429 RepID=UPI001058B073|nr:hypothetical protein [Segetibacter sp. 3557_3]TDH21609.1 hypothetical protein EXU57_19080 [Segetibacter sp. 3557_3]
MSRSELIFVYNAGSGLFDSLTDFAHKIIAPSTYQCRLCALTYGNFTVKQQWKDFISQLPIKVSFLHKDEFARLNTSGVALPAVFIRSDDSLTLFVSNNQINECRTLNDLQELLLSALATYDQHNHTNL